MATKKEIQQRIIKAINAKTGKKVCPMCGHNAWNIGSYYALVPATEKPVETVISGRVFPSIPLICANCGNTQLFNLLFLGFTEDDWDSLRLSGDG